MNAERLLLHYERIVDAPDPVGCLRRFILDLAVRGKLIPQDPDDEPAWGLLKRINEQRILSATERRKFASFPAIDQPPFDIPENWCWARIREITTERGHKIPNSAFTYIDVTAIDKEVGAIVGPKVLQAIEAPSRARKITRKGDVVYSCVRPYLLNVAVIETDFDPEPIASTAFAILDGQGFVLPRYLWIVLRSPFMVICVQERQRGQAYPAINDADFAMLACPLPPLAEQHRIVGKVSELMALCDRLETARTIRETRRNRLTAASVARLNAPDSETFRDDARFALKILPALTTRPDQIQRLRDTVLSLAIRGQLVSQEPTDTSAGKWVNQVLSVTPTSRHSITKPLFSVPESWLWIQMGDVFEVSGGIQKTPQRAPQNNAHPYLGVANVYRGRLNLTTIKQFELKEGELERWRLEPGDILVIEGNGSLDEIGRCAKWKGEIKDCVHQNHVIRCRPRDPRLSDFVLLFLNSPSGRRHHAATGDY